ncbi:hypothetical protein SAMN05444050_7169 [Afipia sp. GAS231]|nr:hypothetical protein SAMN05444050_7169 [Afipia sp. GAS231]
MSLKTGENILMVFETVIVVSAVLWVPANLACVRDGQAFPLRVKSCRIRPFGPCPLFPR